MIRQELGKTYIVRDTADCRLRRKSHLQKMEGTRFIKRDFRSCSNGQLHGNISSLVLERAKLILSFDTEEGVRCLNRKPVSDTAGGFCHLSTQFACPNIHAFKLQVSHSTRPAYNTEHGYTIYFFIYAEASVLIALIIATITV